MLKIKFLGHTTITNNSKNITNDFSKKNIALLFLLIVNEKKYMARDKLALYLWPESNEKSSKYNVRYNIWMLCKCLPKDANENELILIDKNSYKINPEYEYKCDLLSILNCDTSSKNIKALSDIVNNSFSGEVMEGWFISHCYEFNELILLYRMQIERKQLKILEILSESYFIDKKYDKALKALKKAEDFDPTSERVAEHIMKAYSATNDRVSGINYYKEFESRLWKDLQILPNKKLQKLYKNLVNSNINITNFESLENEICLMDIKGYGVESIEWSLISCIINGIASKISDVVIEGIPEELILENSYINQKLLIKFNKVTDLNLKPPKKLSTVRIMQSFVNLLEYTSNYFNIKISIDEFDCADKISKDVINYIENVQKNIEIFK